MAEGARKTEYTDIGIDCAVRGGASTARWKRERDVQSGRAATSPCRGRNLNPPTLDRTIWGSNTEDEHQIVV